MKIKECVMEIRGRMIFDSRGCPTVEVEMSTQYGKVQSSCPSGASTGSQEAIELRDNDSSMCRGKSVCRAVKSVETLGQALMESDLAVTEQREIDTMMCTIDGTANKSRMGANAILPVSMSFVRLGAQAMNIAVWEYISVLCGGSRKKKMPKMYFNVINGGAHADSGLFVQEVMVAFGGSTPFEVLCEASAYISHMKDVVKSTYGSASVGDEGGYAPKIHSIEEAMDIVAETSKKSGIQTEIAIDAAASEFYTAEGRYNIGWKNGEEKMLSAEELGAYYKGLAEKYGIKMIEDPFAEKDYAAWEAFAPQAEKIGVRVVGDDLIVTNKTLIKEAGEKRWCNVALIKMNQIGTVTETIEAVQEARAQGMSVMVSHRSGETEDVLLAHLGVGIEAEYMKAGSLCRTERVCKYNEMIRIFDE